MFLPTFICLMAAIFIVQAEAQTSLDPRLNMKRISYLTTFYGSVTFGDVKKLHTALCGDSTFEYTVTRTSFNTTLTKINDFPKNLDPKNYQSSFLCERNHNYFFICQRISKNYTPQYMQRWYRFQIDNVLCNTNCVNVLSGVDQLLENKHFIDVTLELSKHCERLSSGTLATKGSTDILSVSQNLKLTQSASVSATVQRSTLKTNSKFTFKAISGSRFDSKSNFETSTLPEARSNLVSLFTSMSTRNVHKYPTNPSSEVRPCYSSTRADTGNSTSSATDARNKVDLYVVIILTVALGLMIAVLSAAVCGLLIKRRRKRDTGSFPLEEISGNNGKNTSAIIDIFEPKVKNKPNQKGL
ncbi:unnamed protein product [Lymnaea stagnalis]|uniref:Uncharacterized protein n=1 Tax=Lymnaea stagnalis TaxID=6523 RepID=A0AAV2H4D9_LYMST